MNRSNLFTPKCKMADLILRNYALLSLLPRFDIELGFRDMSVETICNNKNIDLNLFLMVCNIHAFADYTPDNQEIEQLNVDHLMSYLTKSHKYYTEERITSISNKLAKFATNESEQSQILVKFFDEYKREVLNHFLYEDSVVFPYVRSLLTGEANKLFQIDQYEKNHENIDDKLSDLKNILIKYLPDNQPSKDRRQILLDIFLFEEDLDNHTRIEERILVPLVKSIEKSYESK